MNRIEFDKLDKFEQINYINNQLEKSGLTLTKICEKIGIGRSTVRDRFKSVGYTYDKNTNSYITGCNTSVINSNKNKKNNVYNMSNVEIDENNNCNTSVITIDDTILRENIIALAKEYQDIQQMLQDYKQNKMIVNKQIVIDYLSSVEDSETKLTTQRVNKHVLKKFNDFVEKNKQFTKVDLLSQALINFIDQYEQE